MSKDLIDIYSQKENLLRFFLLKRTIGTCLVVQWLKVHAPNAGGTTSVPGWGTKILHAKWYSLKKKKKKDNRKPWGKEIHMSSLVSETSCNKYV